MAFVIQPVAVKSRNTKEHEGTRRNTNVIVNTALRSSADRRGVATERRLAGGAVSRNLPELLYIAAEAAVVAGEGDAALAWLGELLATPSIYMPAWLRVDPTWAPLRGEPRFEALLLSRRAPSSSAR